MNIWRRVFFFAAAALALTARAVSAEPPAPPRLTAVEPTASGQFRVALASQPSVYHLLERADSLAGPWSARALCEGTSGGTFLTDNASMSGRAFYRVRTVPAALPLDADGDGMDDLSEWRAGSAGNPFNPARAPASVDAAVRLADAVTYEKLAHRDNFPGAPGVREVKFLITGADTAAPALFFLNTNLHKFHYYFARDVLGYPEDLATFNQQTYFSDARKHIAGSLVFYPHFTDGSAAPNGMYAVEFWPSDAVPYRHVRAAYDLVSNALPWLDRRLAYHPASITQEQILKAETSLWQSAPVSRISSDALFAATTYSVLNLGVSYGRLVLGGTTTAVSARDIVVLPNVPADLSRVAGIITAAWKSSKKNKPDRRNFKCQIPLIPRNTRPHICQVGK